MSRRTSLEAILRHECELEIIKDDGRHVARMRLPEMTCPHVEVGSPERDAWMTGYAQEKAKMDDQTQHDPVSRPAHYQTAVGIEAIDVIENYGLDVSFHIATAMKYLLRAGKKEGATDLEDLRKANWYLTRHAHFDQTIGITDWPAAVEGADDEMPIEAVIEAFELTGSLAEAVRKLLEIGVSDDEYILLQTGHEYLSAAIAEAESIAAEQELP